MFHMQIVVVYLVFLQVSALPPLSTSSPKDVACCGSPKDRRPVPWPYPNPIPLPQCTPRYIVIPQYNPKSESIFANAPSVTLFTNKFLQAIYSSNILLELFDLSQTTAKQFADYGRENLERFLADLGFKNAVKTLPEFAFRAIAPNFDVLTLPILSNLYANTAANYLYVTGVLTVDNAEEISLSYAQRLAESAKVKMNSDPTSKFQALFDAGHFLLSIVGYSKRNAVTLCYYIGNEWFLAALNYRGL